MDELKTEAIAKCIEMCVPYAVPLAAQEQKDKSK